MPFVTRERLQKMCDDAQKEWAKQEVYASYMGAIQIIASDSVLTLLVEETSKSDIPAKKLWRSVIQAFPYKLIPDKTTLCGTRIVLDNEQKIMARFSFPLVPKPKPGPANQTLVDIHLQVPLEMWNRLTTARDATMLPINHIIRIAINKWLKKQ